MAGDDVLTEGEIDALMESVDDSASAADMADDGQYRRFDFAAREHAMLRQFTALGPLLERQADILGSALEDAFSIDFTTRADAPALLCVADLVASLEPGVAVTNATLEPLQGPVYVVAPAPLLSFVVNAYFGGGLAGDRQSGQGALKPSELHLAERIAGLAFNSLARAWAEKLPLEAGDATTLDVPDRLEMLPGADLLLRLQFELRAGEAEHVLQVLLPFSALEPYRARFAPTGRSGDAEDGQSWEPFFRRELPVVSVEVGGVLAQREITIAELVELAAGMVVPLPPPEMVSLRVGGMTLAEGRYGSFEGARAVQLQRLGKALDQGNG